jgi:hypothetical protein
MMNASAAITLEPQTLPAAVVLSNVIRCELKRVADGTVAAATNTYTFDLSATFTGVADGAYTVTAARLDDANNQVGTPAQSAPFDVVNMQTASLPATVTVTLS